MMEIEIRKAGRPRIYSDQERKIRRAEAAARSYKKARESKNQTFIATISRKNAKYYEKHKEEIIKRNHTPWTCPVCNKTMKRMSKFAHVKTESHIKKTEAVKKTETPKN